MLFRSIAPPPPVDLEPDPAPWEVEGDTVTIRCGKRLPPVGWSHVLCNSGFGWLTDESGAGLLWAGGNSREGKLTPWVNDPLAVGGQEKIMVNLNGQEFSVFAAGDGLPCTVTYRPGLARWEKKLPGAGLTAEGFVPVDDGRRVLRDRKSTRLNSSHWS